MYCIGSQLVTVHLRPVQQQHKNQAPVFCLDYCQRIRPPAQTQPRKSVSLNVSHTVQPGRAVKQQFRALLMLPGLEPNSLSFSERRAGDSHPLFLLVVKETIKTHTKREGKVKPLRQQPQVGRRNKGKRRRLFSQSAEGGREIPFQHATEGLTVGCS